jgi:CRISPR/Cas system endoribonuclease Cas6 (RAMP superfamily)
MKFGGLIGSISLQKISKEVYLILKLGEQLHAGKQTTFGLGKYVFIKKS